MKQCWCIPPQADAAFVHNMEDVLAVYQRPADDRFPVVCVDETSKQLVSETRVPLAPAPGQPGPATTTSTGARASATCS